MPYGDLICERVQRFAAIVDLDAARCTIESTMTASIFAAGTRAADPAASSCP
jgi:hypothetical protein